MSCLIDSTILMRPIDVGLLCLGVTVGGMAIGYVWGFFRGRRPKPKGPRFDGGCW